MSRLDIIHEGYAIEEEPMNPRGQIYILDGTLIMHPADAAELRDSLRCQVCGESLVSGSATVPFLEHCREVDDRLHQVAEVMET